MEPALDAVRQLIVDRLKEMGATMKAASLAIGRNHAYLQQFIERGSPAELSERNRLNLAAFLQIDERRLRQWAPLDIAGVEIESPRTDPPPTKPRGFTPEAGGPSDLSGVGVLDFQLRAAPGAIPVMGEVAAGVWREVEATDVSPFEPVPVAPNSKYPAGAQYGLVVRGTSMNRIAVDGDVLVCLSVDVTEPADNDLVIFERCRAQEGLRETTVKRLRFRDGVMELWPESDDPRFQEPIRIAGDTPEGDEAGRVIAVVDWIYRPVRRPIR